MKLKKVATVCLALVLLLLWMPKHADAADYIYPSNNGDVAGWSVRSDGDVLYFSYGGKTSSPYWMAPECAVHYSDGRSGTFQLITVAANQTGTLNYNWSQIGKIDVKGSVDGNYSASFTLPLSFFASPDFTLTFCGTSVASKDIPGMGGSQPQETQPQETAPQETQPAEKPVVSGNTVPGRIQVDGRLKDWASVDARASVDAKISSWKAVRDEYGNVYLSFTGTSSTQWDCDYQWKILEISQNGNTQQYQIVSLQYSGAEVVTVNEANGNTAAPYYVEAMIPAGMFTDPNFTLTFAGTSVPASALAVLDGVADAQETAAYTGIVIDGIFEDWDAVAKKEIDEISGNGVHNLESTAVVFDGDYVYIYLRERKGGSACGAGTHSNGQYAITTDLNRTMVFQLTIQDDINGVEGASAAHVGAQWEVAIPVSQLPKYLKSVSFGLYLAEPFITGVKDLQGSNSGGSFNGIAYDGLYGDWAYYPHTVIEYATAGTQEELADAEGALYLSGSVLFGHTLTTMPAHLLRGGYELTHNITFKFNDNENQLFYPRAVAVDSAGNINWNPQLANLPNGTYEVYLVSLDAWGTSPNISDLNAMDQIYGKMMFTINSASIDECEYMLYTDAVARKLNINEHDLKTIAVQFGELGTQWITYTGVSTGPWLGIAICCGAVAVCCGAPILLKKKKQVI